MNALISRRLLTFLPPLLSFVAGGVVISACSASKNKASSGASTNGAYASYPSDGHYNPYPGGSQPAPQYQEYTEAPPPPKPSGSRSSGSTASSGSSSKPKKTTASTAKKKSSTTSKTPSKSTGSGTYYVVKRGDSLSSIARKYHTTVSKLKSANGLTSDLIRDGKKLKIP